MAQVGVGIVGTGTIAQSHVQGLRGFDGAKVLSVFDVIPEAAERTAKQHDIPHVASSLEDLLAQPGLDAVIVATPPFAHADSTIKSLQAGKHVLCEKPFALDPAEAEQMVQAAEKAGKFLACASARYRYGQLQQEAHKLIERGDLGDVYHVRWTMWRLRGRPGDQILPQSAWFLDHARAGGGVMMDLAVYMIDSVLWLLGNPKVNSVLAQMRQITEVPPAGGLKQDVEDNVILLLQCEGGKSAYVETAWMSNLRQVDGLVIAGTKAGLRADPLVKITANEMDTTGMPPMPWLGPKMYRAVEEQVFAFPEWASAGGSGNVTKGFVEGIIAGKQPYTPGVDALQVTRVIDAAYRSVREQTAIKLG